MQYAKWWRPDQRPRLFFLVDAVQVQPEQRPLLKVAVLEPEFVQRARVGDKDPTLRDLELAPSRAARGVCVASRQSISIHYPSAVSGFSGRGERART